MMALSRRPYDNGMPNAVAGNLHCSPILAWEELRFRNISAENCAEVRVLRFRFSL